MYLDVSLLEICKGADQRADCSAYVNLTRMGYPRLAIENLVIQISVQFQDT